MDNKKVSQVTFRDIIENKIVFTVKNDIFDREEYKNINDGEILAYNQMLQDIEVMEVQEFENKYSKIFKEINQRLDAELIRDSSQIEKMIGYSNAIVSVLKLINPIYEYRM